MKIRSSLPLKISLLAFLNVSLLALVFFLFARFQFRFDLSSFLLAPARDRILSTSRLLALEFAEEPMTKWNDSLSRHAKSALANLYLFADDDNSWRGLPLSFPTAFAPRLCEAAIITDPARNGSVSRLCWGLRRCYWSVPLQSMNTG